MSYFNNLKGASENEVTATMDQRSSESLVNSYSFERTEGYQNTASLEVMAGMEWGIGVVGKLEVTTRFSSTWETSSTWTRSNSKEVKTDSGQAFSFTTKCKPKCFCQVDVQVDMAKASIPYTLTTRTKGSTDEAKYCVEKGIMKAVGTWNAKAVSK